MKQIRNRPEYVTHQEFITNPNLIKELSKHHGKNGKIANYQELLRLDPNAIQRNLENIQKGKPLDIPLRVLNGEFKKEYFKKKDNRKNL